MRTIGVLALALLCGSCMAQILVGLGVTATALAPGAAGVLAGASGKGDGEGQIGYANVRGDDERENGGKPVRGGHGFYMSSAGYYGTSRLAAYMHGRVEVGSYGRDRLYGFTGMDVGPGLRLNRELAIGASIGYRYGGYPQIGSTIPTRIGLFYGTPSFAFDASAYTGWRFSIRDEYPAATDRFGPGWNTWGADGYLTFVSKEHRGIGVGISYDREDDIDVLVFRIGAGAHQHGRD